MSATLPEKITDFYPFQVEGDLEGEFVLCTDQSLQSNFHHSGAFSLNLLLLKALKHQKNDVVLLLSSTTEAHFRSIFVKNV
jgi:hypothetical protein